MKKLYWMAPLGLALCVAPFAVHRAMAASRSLNAADLDAPTAAVTSNTPTSNAPTSSTRRNNDATQNTRVARALADFDNARPDRGETAWGRFVADALRDRAQTDIAFVNAGALENGTLQSGDVSESDIVNLLSFGDDEVAIVQLSGAQLRAALERAVGAFPTGSPAWLHLSGATTTFDARAKNGSRLKTLQVNGHDVEASDSFTVAMPIGLAEGGSGYYKIWKGGAQSVGTSVLQTVVNYARARKDISPDDTPRVRAS